MLPLSCTRAIRVFRIRAHVFRAVLIGCAALLFTASAYAASITSLGKSRSATPVGPVVAAGTTGTACGFVSGGAVGPFASLGPAALTGNPCPTTPAAVTIRETLSALGVSAVGDFTSRGGTIAKATPQTVSMFWRRTAVGGATLATGAGGWTTAGTAAGTPVGTVEYSVSADGGFAGGVVYGGVGFAEDPFELGAGTYAYQPALVELSLSNEDADGLAALILFAETTAGPLWTLDISLAEGQATVDFTSFPSATALGISVDDSSVESALTAALTLSGSGSLTLSSPQPLFSNSVFMTLNGPTTFMEGVIAYAGPQQRVPEPGTIVLIAAAIGVLLWRKRTIQRSHQGAE